MTTGQNGFFPWQTPQGEGFRWPWEREKPDDGFDAYLDRLTYYLALKVQTGDLPAREARTLETQVLRDIEIAKEQGLTLDSTFEKDSDLINQLPYWNELVGASPEAYFEDVTKLWNEGQRISTKKGVGRTPGQLKTQKAEAEAFAFTSQQDLKSLKEQRRNEQFAQFGDIRGTAMARSLQGPPGTSRQAEQFEREREKILGSLTGPANWIKKREAEIKPNPFKQKLRTTDEEVAFWRGEEKERSLAAKEVSRRATDPNDPLTWQKIWNPGTLEEQMAGQIIQAQKTALTRLTESEGEQAIERERSGGWDIGTYPSDVTGEEVPYRIFRQDEDTAPIPVDIPTPSWLTKFAPRQAAGAELQKQRIPTPSGQQWARTPWSEREGLRGFTEWAGFRDLRDIEGQMAMMQPRTPWGAGNQRWAPARQRG